MKHTTSRLLALLLAMMMLVGCLTACGGEAPAEEATTTESTTTTTTESTTETTTVGEVTTESATESTTETTTEAPTTESTTTTTTAAPTVAPTETPTQAPTESTTTSSSGKHVITYTTYNTTTEAPTTTKAPKNPLRVLSIGHSFSKDAMEAYLWDLLNSSGKYDYIVIAYLFYPGCPLDGQWDRISGKTDPETGMPYEYQQYRKTDPYTGAWQTMYKPENYKNLAEFAIKDEKWDVITLQPSPDYGPGPEICNGQNDYDNVGNILNWINRSKTNSNAKVMYHMTWAFAEDCKLWSFMYSNWNQMEMYNNFVNATKKYIFDAHPGQFANIIPAGTAIQNARSSKLGDVFNMPGGYEADNKTAKDGYHLNERGDFVAALTWYCVLTGNNAKKAECPPEWAEEFDIFVDAVNAAIKKPYEVTQSKYKK